MKLKKLTLKIKGMHCPSCEILVKDKFKEEKNVISVKPDYKKQMAEIVFHGVLNKEKINEKLRKFGYQINERQIKEKESIFGRLGLFLIFLTSWVLIYLMVKDFSFFNNFKLNSTFQLTSIFILGLIASFSTCMATSGALFLSTLEPGKNNLQKAFYFNLGRIVSYGFFGFSAGLIGKQILTNFYASTGLSFFISLLLIFLGLDMAKIFRLSAIFPYEKTGGIFNKLENYFIKNRQQSEFFLGFLTYFLPCGFTYTTQIYVLSFGNPWFSGFGMMIFAIGTTPAIFLIAYFEKFFRHHFISLFYKAMAALVFLVGIYYFYNSLALVGVNIVFSSSVSSSLKNVKVENGWQVIEMVVDGRGYTPNEFIVKKGQPVRWWIKGENVYGCQGYFVVPELGIRKALSPGNNFFEFTPQEKKSILFSCGMGMYRGRIEVID